MIVAHDVVARGRGRRAPGLAGGRGRHHEAQGGRRAHQRHHPRRDPEGPSRCAAGSRSSRAATSRPASTRSSWATRSPTACRASSSARSVKLQKRDWTVVGIFSSRGRRLRERDLGRPRRDRPGLRAHGRHATRMARAPQGARPASRPSTPGSAPTRRCSCRRWRSGSTTRTRRGRWPRSCASWPPSWR